MKLSEFVNKFLSRYLWWNLIAMGVVCILLVVGVKFGLDIYTHHGEKIDVPNVHHMSMAEARRLLQDRGLEVMVSDTGYVKELPADCILEQTPMAGSKVKSGHCVSLVVNASNTPVLTMPDIVENCSSREAMAKLKALGFKVGMPEFVEGEKDWVYAVTVDGRECSAGDKIPVNKVVVIRVGNGTLSPEDSVQYVDYRLEEDYTDESGEVDDFVEIH